MVFKNFSWGGGRFEIIFTTNSHGEFYLITISSIQTHIYNVQKIVDLFLAKHKTLENIGNMCNILFLRSFIQK